MYKLRGLYPLGVVLEAALAFMHGLALLIVIACALAAPLTWLAGKGLAAAALAAFAALLLWLQISTRMRYVLALGALRRCEERLQIHDLEKDAWVDAYAAGISGVKECEEGESSPFGPFSYELPALQIKLRSGRVITHLSPNARMHGIGYAALRAVIVKIERDGPQFPGALASRPFQGLDTDESTSRERAAKFFSEPSTRAAQRRDATDWRAIARIAALAALVIYLIFLFTRMEPDILPVIDAKPDRRGLKWTDRALILLLGATVVLFLVKGRGRGKYLVLTARIVVALALAAWTLWLTLKWQGVAV